MANLLDRLCDGPVLASSPPIDVPALARAVLENPDEVSAHYGAAVEAGARLLVTATPEGGYPERLAGLDQKAGVAELNWRAARLAADVAGEYPGVVVAGLVTLGLDGQLPSEMREQMGALLDGGSKAMILDAMRATQAQALEAVDCFQNLTNVPLAVVLALTGFTDSAGDLNAAWQALLDADVDIVVLSTAGIAVDNLSDLLAASPASTDDFTGIGIDVPEAGTVDDATAGRITEISTQAGAALILPGNGCRTETVRALAALLDRE